MKNFYDAWEENTGCMELRSLVWRPPIVDNKETSDPVPGALSGHF